MAPRLASVPDRNLDDVFEAVVGATEEAVRALPHDEVLELLRAHGRLAGD